MRIFNRSKVEKFLANPAKKYVQGSNGKICVRVSGRPRTYNLSV